MKLFKHQEEGIKILTGLNPDGGHSFLLADSMGLGKTRQSIVAAKKNRKNGTLIVCPASLKINWQREIEMVYPEEKSEILNSGDAIFENFEWYIINYDILGKMSGKIEMAIKLGWIDILILDEAHYIKGDSLRSKAIIGGRKMKKSGEKASFKGLIKLVDSITCLTGTPILNKPIELFNILKAIGHPLAKSKERYAERYCGRFWMYRIWDGHRHYTISSSVYYAKFNKPGVQIKLRWPDDSGATHLDELREQLKGWMIRRKKEEVLDLPEKIISIKEFEIDKEWTKKYENAFDDYIQFRKDNPIEGWNKQNVLMSRQLVEIQKLKQVCSLAKVDTIVEDIQEAINQGEKVIVFSQYTKTIDAITDKMQELGIGVTALTGDCDMVYRQASVDVFQNDPRVKVFVANIKAGGVGITLTAASIVMFADMDWSPEIHNQAMDRAHRIGQTGTVNVYYYVAKGTIEEDIIRLLEDKKNIAEQILDGSKVRLQKSSVFGEFLKRTEVGTK
jgi:SWI/SNF-related matrix-associated actin-dependent regulator 1 of chromatin subfamily A